MLRFLFVVSLAVLSLAAPAHAGEALSDIYAVWEKLRAPETTTIDFTEGASFMADHPGWPEEKTIRLRTEAAAMQQRPARAVMQKFCTNFPPISGRGMIACAAAEFAPLTQRTAWVSQAWLQGDFNADEESRIVKSYANILTHEQHNNRMERLLYDGKSAAAKRMLPLVTPKKRALYTVRIAFSEENKHAIKMLAALPPIQQRDTGILFDRARWRINHGDDTSIAELLLTVPSNAPYPDAWWPMRARAARDAIGQRNYNLAFKMIAHHGDLKGEALADALWLKGWISLRYKRNATDAYKDFFALYTNVYTPVSKARAAYWAARAAEVNGNKDIANEWLLKAARYPTVFYGQLAHNKLYPKKPLPLPTLRKATALEKKEFEADPLVIVARTLDKTGTKKMRDLFLGALATQTSNEAHFALVAQLARELGGTATGVDIAKLALRNGIILMDTGWPQIPIPEGLRIEPPLTLAITRQESEFDPTARSTANARGLMQLLPATAKETARKLDINYSDTMLEDPAANMTFGSAYLGQLIEGFDGSYILGIASYNAGPGSVRKWIAARGRPPKNLENAIDWIESIPFGETRNYVMRALENVSVYRSLNDPTVPLAIAQDIVR